MDRILQGFCHAIGKPLPFVGGLYQLIPETDLAIILTRTARNIGTPVRKNSYANGGDDGAERV